MKVDIEQVEKVAEVLKRRFSNLSIKLVLSITKEILEVLYGDEVDESDSTR